MKHQSISRWLSQLGLPQYCIALEQEYDGVEVKKQTNIWINEPTNIWRDMYMTIDLSYYL